MPKPKAKPTLLDPEMIPSENRPSRRLPSLSMSHLPWIILLIVLLAAGIFVFNQQREAKVLKAELEEIKNNPQKVTEEESKVLLEKVGQLIELPDEQPTIATVTDLAPLQDQPFFANAQVGDKVLIYATAKKAVLYRPSTNKVIEVAPVDLDAPVVNANTTTNSNTNSNTGSTSRSSTTNTNTNNTNTTTQDDEE